MTNTTTYQVARATESIYVRVNGQGNMNNCVTLQAFCQEMIKKGAEKFVIDLDCCPGMDSTFMGLLLQLSYVKEGTTEGVVLLNVSDHCKNQLEGVGLNNILTIKCGTTEPPDLATHQLPEKTASAVERLKIIMKAHVALTQVDDRNARTFGPFLKGLIDELGAD